LCFVLFIKVALVFIGSIISHFFKSSKQAISFTM
jgi:hypothetical protein